MIVEHAGDDELDITEALDDLADRADQEPTSYRWSYSRDFDDQARLVVVDSRAARVLEPDRRSMLDDEEMAWLDERMRGDVDHLLVGTSLPLLMAPGLHHVEAFGEALAQGAWGRLGSKVGEVFRQNADLEHWAAFQGGFVQVAQMVVDVASGRRGRTPRSVTFLSGDVHHSYVAQAWPDPALGVTLDACRGAGHLLADPQPAAGRDEGRDQAGGQGQGTARPAGCWAARSRGHRCGGGSHAAPGTTTTSRSSSSRTTGCTSGGRGARWRVTSTAPGSSVLPRSTSPYLLPSRSAGRPRTGREVVLRAALDVQLGEEAAEPRGHPPVGLAEHVHHGRDQQQPHHGRVDEDRRRHADADHLEDHVGRGDERREHRDHDRRRRGDDPAGAGQAARGWPARCRRVRSQASRIRLTRNTS